MTSSPSWGALTWACQRPRTPRGRCNKLHTWRLAQPRQPGAEEEKKWYTADLGVPVRVGPAISLWSGPWVSELMTLVGHLAEHRRPR